jgi:pimeloyl-ACP methyl ester carboxylesterase
MRNEKIVRINLKMGRKILRSVIPAIFLIVLFLTMNRYVRSMIYPAPSFAVPSMAPKPFQDIWLSKTHAWYFQSPDPAAPVLIHFHGNGENLETLRLSGFMDSLMTLEVSLLAIDYPGYGRSEGTPSEQSIRETSTAAVQWAKQKHPKSKLMVCGWSLGAAVAIDVVSRKQDMVDGLIAISAWTSLHDVAKKHFPAWMVRMLLQESYDSLHAASSVKCPALMIHGEEDTLIPAEQGKRVAEALPNRKSFVLIPQASHNNLLDYPKVWQEIASFVQTVTSSP